jgi:hypothetical protein
MWQFPALAKGKFIREGVPDLNASDVYELREI